MVIKSAVMPSGKSISSRYTPVTPALLRQIARRIVDAFQPEQIILFGSHAYGKPTVGSDIDLLVVLKRLRNQSVIECEQEVGEVARSSVPPNGRLPMDILVRSPAELKHRLKIGDPFLREVVLKGRVLYKRRGSRCRIDAAKWRDRMPEPVLIAEWVQKAEGDYVSALHLLRLRKNPQPAMVCYHCQQCAEKYLKAFLLQHNVHFEKTHDLQDLNELCNQVDGSFAFITDWLKLLNPYAIETRYPGRVIESEEAREAIATMKQVRKFVRAKLGLK